MEAHMCLVSFVYRECGLCESCRKVKVFSKLMLSVTTFMQFNKLFVQVIKMHETEKSVCSFLGGKQTPKHIHTRAP